MSLTLCYNYVYGLIYKQRIIRSTILKEMPGEVHVGGGQQDQLFNFTLRLHDLTRLDLDLGIEIYWYMYLLGRVGSIYVVQVIVLWCVCVVCACVFVCVIFVYVFVCMNGDVNFIIVLYKIAL